MMFSARLSALAAASLLLVAASAEGFLCPVPVIPSTFGPSNACCSKLVKIPLSELVNPEDGAVYYGFNCTSAAVKEEIGDGSTQAITFPCAEDMSSGCCDPTFRHYLGSGPCTQPQSQ